MLRSGTLVFLSLIALVHGCDVGYYGNDTCTKCPAYMTTSSSDAANIEECKCIPSAYQAGPRDCRIRQDDPETVPDHAEHRTVQCNASTLSFRYLEEYSEDKTADSLRDSAHTVYQLNVTTPCRYNILLVGGGGSGKNHGGGGGGGDVLYFQDVLLYAGIYWAYIGGGGVQTDTSGITRENFFYQYEMPRIQRSGGSNSYLFASSCGDYRVDQNHKPDAKTSRNFGCTLSLCSAGGGPGEQYHNTYDYGDIPSPRGCRYYLPGLIPSNSTERWSSGGAGGTTARHWSKTDTEEILIEVDFSIRTQSRPAPWTCTPNCSYVSGGAYSGGGGGGSETDSRPLNWTWIEINNGQRRFVNSADLKGGLGFVSPFQDMVPLYGTGGSSYIDIYLVVSNCSNYGWQPGYHGVGAMDHHLSERTSTGTQRCGKREPSSGNKSSGGGGGGGFLSSDILDTVGGGGVLVLEPAVSPCSETQYMQPLSFLCFPCPPNTTGTGGFGIHSCVCDNNGALNTATLECSCNVDYFVRTRDDTCHACPTSLIHVNSNPIENTHLIRDCKARDGGKTCRCVPSEEVDDAEYKFLKATYDKYFFDEATVQMHGCPITPKASKVIYGHRFNNISDCICVDGYDRRIPMKVNSISRRCECYVDWVFRDADKTCYECPAQYGCSFDRSVGTCSCNKAQNSYFNLSTLSYQPCPSGTTAIRGAMSVQDCQCDQANKVLNVGTLQCECALANVYRPADDSCHPCPSHEGCGFDNINMTCACQAGFNLYFDLRTVEYRPCPPNTTASPGAQSIYSCTCTNAAKQLNVTSSLCVCPPGNVYDTHQDTCYACPPVGGCGFDARVQACVCDAEYNGYYDTEAYEYRKCPPNSTARELAVALQDCTCHDTNKAPDPTTRTCACADGLLLRSSDDTCHACPTQSSSGPQATHLAECHCQQEHTVLQENPPLCVCKDDYYADQGVCLECPLGTKSTAGSTSLAQCTCTAPGRVLDQVRKQCLCPPSEVYISAGDICQQCPADTTAQTGARFLGDCKCIDPNKVLDNTTAKCRCKQGLLVRTNDATCHACPSDASTPLDATTLEDCECTAMYTRLEQVPPTCVCIQNAVHDGTSCQPCPEGHFATQQTGPCWCKPDSGDLERCKGATSLATITTVQASVAGANEDAEGKRDKIIQGVIGFFSEIHSDLIDVKFTSITARRRVLLSTQTHIEINIFSTQPATTTFDVAEVTSVLENAGFTDIEVLPVVVIDGRPPVTNAPGAPGGSSSTQEESADGLGIGIIVVIIIAGFVLLMLVLYLLSRICRHSARVAPEPGTANVRYTLVPVTV